jgi:uncharacterized RDD family membrane protein YckC
VEYEDRLTLATPEGVDLDFALAGLGSRGIALMFDWVLKGLAIAALAVLLLAVVGGSVGLALFLVLSFVVLFAYDVLFEVLASGRTPGKRWTGLRVIEEDGGRVGLRASAVRNVLRMLDGPATLYVVGSIAILASATNQRLGDLAAGTLVIRERHAADRLESAAPAAAVPLGPVPLGAVPAADLSAVSTEDLATVRSFLARRDQLDLNARAYLAGDLAARLRAKVHGGPENVHPEWFLEWVAAAKAASR